MASVGVVRRTTRRSRERPRGLSPKGRRLPSGASRIAIRHRTPRSDQIVCHNDFAPYNCVFQDGHLVGVIDWDVVCAGDPTWDLAFFAWHWVPLYAPAPDIAWRSLDDCQRRLRHIVDSYGLSSRSDFVELIIARVEASRAGIISRANEGDEAFIRLVREGHVAETQRAIDFVRENESLLTDALSP